ncbi:MAG: DUF4038 domain-containing protein [Clostridia bacterium]|nr:DUF4038 domain-containing protein [Clostridia bacterium]
MNKEMMNLRVADDGRHLAYDDGRPFFYLADTAWELFHKLNREEAFLYLQNRAEKGFTVIQAVALAEKDGMRRSNAYGRCPVKIGDDGKFDPAQPDLDGGYSYWDHVDAIVKKAGELGLYIAMLPAWGDKFPGTRGEGPHVFTPENAYAYGEWLGRRYAEAGNIIWVMGGDRTFTTRYQLETLDAMARGIKAGDGGRYLMTMHPAGGQHSSECAHEEDWLDFNMIQSGHTRSRYNYEMIRRDYRRLPYKPVLDGEPNYEGHPESFNILNGYMDDADARRSAYWSVLSGACGHTYGHHSIWNFVTLPDKDTKKGYFAMSWQAALDQPGSGQMKHLKTLIESVEFGEGAPAASMVSGNMEAVNFVPVLKGKNWLIAYSAQGLSFDLNLGAEWDGAKAQWFDPRNGEFSEETTVTAGRIASFDPPSAGRGADWALVLKKS